jgi:hypothetical protein
MPQRHGAPHLRNPCLRHFVIARNNCFDSGKTQKNFSKPPSPCLFLAGYASPGQALLVRIRMSSTAITLNFQSDRPHIKRSGPRQANLQGWAGGQLERQQHSVYCRIITSSLVEEVLYCPSSILFAALLSLPPSSALLFWPLISWLLPHLDCVRLAEG